MASGPPDLESIFSAHSQQIFRYCHRLSGSQSDAEDLTQETFVAAIQGWSSFREEAGILTWLFQIAHNKVRRLQRRQRLARLFSPAPKHSDDAAERFALEDLINRLPLSQKAAFCLVKIEGLSCEEASSILGSPPGTIKYWIHEAVKTLRESLKEDCIGLGEEKKHAL